MSETTNPRGSRGVPLRLPLVIAGALLALVSTMFWIEDGYADHDSNPNEDCPAGTFLVAKYEWTAGGYVFEKPPGGDSIVSVTGDETGGSWTSTQGIDAVILKGSVGTHTYSYSPAATSGTFSKFDLPLNPGGNYPDISNIQFCGGARLPDLTPVKTNDTGGSVVLGEGFDWSVHVSNIGSANAVFAGGAVVLYDELPAGADYEIGTLTPASSGVSGSLTCKTEVVGAGARLVCKVPSGQTFTMQPSGWFTVSFGVTPTIAGVLNNPRDSECWVNLGTGAIPESDTLNNRCSDAVTVIGGTIEVVKVDLGVDGTWQFSATGPSNPANKTIVGDGSVQFQGLRPGAYTVAELNGVGEACPVAGSPPGTFETLRGLTGDTGAATIGTTVAGIPVVAGQLTTVYFFNRECGGVLAAPNLYIQKYEDPLGNLTGTTPIAGVSFIVKKDGVPIAGSPFLSPGDGLIALVGIDEGVYTVEEVIPASYRLAGSTRDDDANLTVEATYPGQPAAVTLEVNDTVRLTFYNQALGAIRVEKTEVVDGVSSAGDGWTFTLSGCGAAEVDATDAEGVIEWTVPVREDCVYRVEETAQAGWKVTPASRFRTAQPVAGETVVLEFENSRTTPGPTPTPTATATPGSPTATPESPTATNTPVPPTPTSPGGLLPATIVPEATPRPPATGTGADDGRGDWPLAGMALGAGLMLLALGLSPAARHRREES